MTSTQEGFAYWASGGVERLERYRANLRKAVDSQSGSVLAAVDRCGGDERRLLADLHSRRERLVSVMAARWQGQQVKRGDYKTSANINYSIYAGPSALDPRPSDVAASMGRLADQLESSRMPLTARARARHLDSEVNDVSAALRQCCAAEQIVLGQLQVVIANTIRNASKPVNQAVQMAAAQWTSPPGVREGLTRSLGTVPRGDGRFILQSGWASITPPEFRVGTETISPSKPVLAAVFLDLDADGGLLTDSRLAVNSISRRMLALLPAGQLQLKVFDPNGLGKSVKDLFAVDAVSGKVLPDKVFSTRRELEELLENLERLLTDVYRKYLGARHRTLHEYNLAAGEVAEPYRLLTIYDYPSGWDRGDGQIDRSLEARLAKVIKAGPACGLFTLLHYANPQDMRAFNLPTLNSYFSGSGLGDWAPTLAQLPTSASANYLITMTDEGMISTARATGPSGLVAWRQECRWVPPGRHDVERGATAEITRQLAIDLRRAGAVSISSGKVTRLTRQKEAEEARTGLGTAGQAADPMATQTWWKGSSAKEVVARFGQLGATDVAEVRIDSDKNYAWLIAGNPGSGKSTLLHAVIADLSRNYAPSELELWLADLKFGVEFRPYAAGSLPHAYVVGLEAGREFGLDVLQRLAAQIGERATLFKNAGGKKDLAAFRATGANLPRIVAVVDEFQGLFEQQDALADSAASAMETVVRLGRAFGVHLVLATQQISGCNVPKTIFEMVSCRIALMSSPSESAEILGDDANFEAAELGRQGEGILNTSPSGKRDHNRRFQTINISPKEVQSVVATCRDLASQSGMPRRPIVLDASRPASMAKSDGAALKNPVQGMNCRIPIGRPMGMGPSSSLVLDRAPGSNALIIADTFRSAALVGQVAAASLLGGLGTTVLDFGGMGSELSQALDPATAAAQRRPASKLRFGQPRDFDTLLQRVSEEVDKRLFNSQFKLAPKLLVLLNVNRSPAMSADNEQRLSRIMQSGPEVGIHLVVQAGTLLLAERFLDYDAVQHLGVRLVGEVGQDSERLTGSRLAEHLRLDQIVLATPSMGTAETVRLFSIDAAKWAQI